MQIASDLTVVHGFVHADVKGLLMRLGMAKSKKDGFDQIADVNEIAFDRLAVRIEHHRDGAGTEVLVGALRSD